ncbi:DUF2568 domain-containing protein [Naumannella sp. ID2617S]|nr:DUF2568 domain-containing protein [Naumannella sp. ID2617S]
MTPLQWALGAAAFAVELALVVVSGVVRFRFARGWGIGLAIAAAVVGVLALGAIWALFMSPNADHRLPLWPRVAGACLLVLATAAALARTGSPRTAATYAIAGCLVMPIAQPALDAVD